MREREIEAGGGSGGGGEGRRRRRRGRERERERERKIARDRHTEDRVQRQRGEDRSTAKLEVLAYVKVWVGRVLIIASGVFRNPAAGAERWNCV